MTDTTIQGLTPASLILPGDRFEGDRNGSPFSFTAQQISSAGQNPTFRNQLINANMDINQRVAASTGGYGMDCWRLTTATTAATMTQTAFAVGEGGQPTGHGDNFMRVAFTSGGTTTSSCYVQQTIEGLSYFSNSNQVLGVWLRGSIAGLVVGIDAISVGLSTTTIYSQQMVPITTNWVFYPFNFTITSLTGLTIAASNGLQVRITVEAGASSTVPKVGNQSGTIDIYQPQFERGNIVTPFEYRPIGVEMPLCLRRFEKSYDYSVAPAAVSATGITYFQMGGLTSATRVVTLYTSYKIPKRINPTVTLYSHVTGASTKVRDVIANVDLTPGTVSNATGSWTSDITTTTANTTVAIAAQWTSSADF